MSSERPPKSRRKEIRAQKAETRRDFALSGEQRDAAKTRAQNRLFALSQSLTDLLNDKDFATLTDSSQTQYALDFVETTWLRFGLRVIGEEERDAEINAFLDTCPEVLLEFLTTEIRLPDNRWLTPLQQIKNRVISPITGALDVR